jgi:cytochrome c biogenesis factor
LIAAALIYGGYQFIDLTKSANEKAESYASGGGEAGVIWILTAPFYALGWVLLIVGILMGAVWALSRIAQTQSDE